MADQLQLRGGTTAEHSTFTGALREVTVDTDKDVLVVHDNSTAGGHPLMAEDGSNSALALGSAGTPSLKFTGDTNTGVFSPAADTVAVSTAGSEAIRVDSSGRLLVGTTSATAVSTMNLQSNSGGTGAPILSLQRSDAPTGTEDLGSIHFADSSENNAAFIIGERDSGTWTSGSSHPGALVFATTSDGASSPTFRMRIDSSGRVGIGTSVPDRLLHVQAGIAGTVDANGSAQLVVENSADAGINILAPNTAEGWLMFGDDDDNFVGGLSYDHTNDLLSVYANNAERMTINSSGNVGIGTTGPSTDLHVSKAASAEIRVSGTANGSDATIGAHGTHSGGGTRNVSLKYDSSSDTYQLITTTGNALTFNVSSNERARIDGNGLSLGISSQRSDFFNTTNTRPTFQIEGNATDNRIASIISNSTSSGAGAVLVLGHEKSGSTGGSTAVANDDLVGRLSFQGHDGTTFVESAYIESFVDHAVSTDDMPGRLTFSTTANGAAAPSERMRITNAGFTKIANDATYVNATGLWHEIGSNQNSSDTLRITHRGASSPYGVIVEFQNASPDNNSNYFINCSDSTEARMRVYSDGDVVNHDNSYGSFSDQKLKQDIVDAGSQWDDLKNLRVRKFKFKSDVEAYGDNAKTLIGLVAQEAETVSPGLVKNNPDKDAENNDLGTFTKTVNYSVLYMKAVKALQEAMERIETLEAKVAALEAN